MLETALESFDGLTRIAGLDEGGAEVIVGSGEIRLESNSLPEFGNRISSASFCRYATPSQLRASAERGLFLRAS
jgi:hypothetical protein